MNYSEDNLGLGAGQRSNCYSTQCTGLDAFQGLLGRLNGKSEKDLEKEKKARDSLKATLYAENKWGGLRFVSGGFLVGTRQEIFEDNQSSHTAMVAGECSLTASVSTPEIGDLDKVLSIEEEKALSGASTIALPNGEAPEKNNQESATKAFNKAQRKLEKAQRKLDRRKKREVKEARREARQSKQIQPSCEEGAETIQKVEGGSMSDKVNIRPQVLLMTKAALPVQETKVSPVSHAILQGGRHAIRQRHIQHKKMAVMDPKALNEVLMPFSTALNQANHS